MKHPGSRAWESFVFGRDTGHDHWDIQESSLLFSSDHGKISACYLCLQSVFIAQQSQTPISEARLGSPVKQQAPALLGAVSGCPPSEGAALPPWRAQGDTKCSPAHTTGVGWPTQPGVWAAWQHLLFPQPQAGPSGLEGCCTVGFWHTYRTPEFLPLSWDAYLFWDLSCSLPALGFEMRTPSETRAVHSSSPSHPGPTLSKWQPKLINHLQCVWFTA